MSNVWFTADEHYGHESIIKFCNRPFENTNEMTDKIVSNHNEVVKPGDLVYHLGDMFWRTLTVEQALGIRLGLNGQHFYIYGNHEELMQKNKVLRDTFVWVRDLQNLKFGVGVPNIVLCHYAMRVWNGSHRGSYQLYGHTHGELPEEGWLSMDVGVDAHNFYPVSLEQVRATLGSRAAQAKNKMWTCSCGNMFKAVDTSLKICSRCNGEMVLA